MSVDDFLRASGWPVASATSAEIEQEIITDIAFQIADEVWKDIVNPPRWIVEKMQRQWEEKMALRSKRRRAKRFPLREPWWEGME